MLIGFFTLVGFVVVVFHVGLILLEIFRSLYWAVWETIPLARNYPDTATVWNITKSIGSRFWREFTGGYVYDKVSCQHYSHSYWPWQEREWYSNND